MSTGREDDAAFSWGGDDDPTLDVGGADLPRAADDSAALPDGYTAVGKGSEAFTGADAPDTTSDADADADTGQPASTAEGAPIGNAALVSLGVLGGVYLLYTVGWIIGGLRLQDVAVFLVSPAAYVPAFVLAVLAPAVWFAATYLLTRRSKTWLRFAWLVAGAILLVPWPFIMVGAFGQ